MSDALDDITVDGTLEAVHCVWYGQMPYDLTAKTVSGANVQASESTSNETESSDGDTSDNNGDSPRLTRRAPSPTMTSTSSIASYW